MLIIGCHVSFGNKEQLQGSLNEALSYGANTFMFYTGAPQNTRRCKIDEKITLEAKEKMKDNNIDIKNIIVHAPYIINLANRQDESKFQFSVSFLKEEIARCESIGVRYLVLHPGSHVGSGLDIGIKNIVDALNTCLSGHNITILLETMSGKGTEIGCKFEDIKAIIEGVNNKDNIGVCLDTCHLSDSGYDISNFDKVLDEFDSIVGLEYVKCIHVNDSKNIQGSKKDRHENIGLGHIGFDNIINIIYNPRINDIPKILETPWIDGKPPYKEEIEMIRKKAFDGDFKNKIIKN